MNGARALAKLLLAVLIAANLVVAAGWLATERLIGYGILSGPEPLRIDLEPLPLPAIKEPSIVEPTRLAAAKDNDDSARLAPEAAAATASIDAPAHTVCAVVGPFNDRDAAQAAASTIDAAGGSAQWREETIAAAPDYLVYIEPALAKGVAVATWQALRAQSIEAYIIPSGIRRNGISVGVFSERERAVAQRLRVAKLGHQVQMVALNRTATSYRLLARVVPEALIDQPHVPCDE